MCFLQTNMSSAIKVKSGSQGHFAMSGIELGLYLLTYVFMKVESTFQYKSAHFYFLWYANMTSLSATWWLKVEFIIKIMNIF